MPMVKKSKSVVKDSPAVLRVGAEVCSLYSHARAAAEKSKQKPLRFEVLGERAKGPWLKVARVIVEKVGRRTRT